MHLPNGSQIFIGNTLAAALPATAVSNASSPVLSMASTSGLAEGDYVIVTESSWGQLKDRVLRVSAVSTGVSATLDGIDTTDTNVFPAGATASIAKITSWVEIPCVQDLSQEGGEQQYYTYQCLSDDREQQLPTFKSAVSLTYTFAHEFTDPIYPVLRKLDESGAVTPLRMYIPKATEIRLWAGVLSFNDMPQTTVNEMETVSLSVSLKGRFTFLPAV